MTLPADDVLTGSAGLLHLRAAGVSLVLDVSGAGVPSVLHWGSDLGGRLPPPVVWERPVPPGSVDTPSPLTLLPGGGGSQHESVLQGARDGGGLVADWRLVDVAATTTSVTVRCLTETAGLSVRTDLEMAPTGVLRVRHTVTNDGSTPYRLHRLTVVLPVPAVATELLDLTGRWCRERHPQRHPFTGQGTWSRPSRHGRTGHDATLLLMAGVPGFGNRHGQVWGLHLAWSGNHTTYAERRPDGRAVLAAGELLEPGEVVLAPGEEYVTPDVLAVTSDEGLDGLSRRLHGFVRARAGHPRRPRPAVLNTWEAVYFDHRLERLTALADAAAGVGVERFVLDDGWFLHRRDDRSGLGDWTVDPQVWPAGLGPLIDHVRGLGMEFGIWVEPEMVNLSSALYREHPDWVLRSGDRLPAEWRHQQVVDLTAPAAFGHVLDRLDALLRDHEIAFLKWDHNRDLIDAGHLGQPAVRAQTLSVYRLLDELRARHPGVEIESCASGGARVDLGILERTDRVWASDTLDALERQTIARWTQLLLPPELVGSHVGPPTAHTTGRTHSLSFRGATALFGHFGIEWDISALDPEGRDAVRRLVSTYRRHRALLHSGDVVHADHPDPSAVVHGVVSTDRSEALFAYVALATSAAEVPAPALLPGLDPDAAYKLEVVDTGGAPFLTQTAPPGWTRSSAALTGRYLGQVGLPMPVLGPEQALVVHLRAT